MNNVNEQDANELVQEITGEPHAEQVAEELREKLGVDATVENGVPVVHVPPVESPGEHKDEATGGALAIPRAASFALVDGPALIDAAVAKERTRRGEVVVTYVQELIRRREAVQRDIEKGQKALDKLNRQLTAVDANEFTVDDVSLKIRFKADDLNREK